MTGVFLILLSYLIGSFPSAYLAGRLLKGIDIRKVGDRNAGAANVYRHVGHTAGFMVSIIDISKGIVTILLAKAFSASEPVVLLCGLAAVAGHNWPVFIGFKGGRGAATTLGILLALLPKAIVPLLALSSIPFFLTRNTSLVCATIFAPLPFVARFMGASWLLIGYALALPCLVGLTHLFSTRHLSEEARHETHYIR